MKARRKPSGKRDARPGVPGPAEPSRRSFWMVVVGAGLAAFLLYLPTLRSGFVYDAEAQILINGYIHDPGNFGEVVTFQVLGRDVLDFNRPVQLFSLMIDSFFWGKNPFGYHLTSNILHAVNVALLVALIFQLTEGMKTPPSSRLLAAAVGGLLFACHPVLAEPVAEVACREDLLATGWVLGGLLCAVAFSRRSGRSAFGWAIGCVLAMIFASASKETGVVGPFLLAASWGLFFRDQPRQRWIALVSAAMVAVGAFFALRFALQPQDSQIFEVPPKFLGGSLEAAIRIQPRLWILSLKNILWPDALSADYQPGNVLALPLGVGLAGLVLFVGGQGFLAFKSRLAAMGMLMFWLGLAPVSNLVPIYRPIADRFLYMPLAGMALLVVGGLLLVAGRRMIFGLLFGLLVTGLILSLLPLSLATWRRQAVFANSIALWQDTLAKSPTSDTAANNLGFAFIRSGDHEAALEAFQLALNLTKGRKPNALAGVAIALESLNRPKEAEQYYQAAIADNAKYGDPDGLVERMEVNLDDADVLKQIQARLPALQKNRTP